MTRILIPLFLLLFSINLYAQPLPVEAFGLLPQSEQVKLSPDGKRFAYLLNYQGKTLVGVTEVDSGKKNFIIKTDNKKFKIGWYKWANNDLLLVSADYPVHRNGIKYSESRLIKVKADGTGKVESVLRLKKGERSPQFQNNIIDLLPDEPNYILMGLDLKAVNRPDVCKMIYRSRSHISYWLTDQQHRVRLGYGRDETKIFYRLHDLATDEWRNIWEYEIFDAPDITPLGFGLNPSELYIRAIHNGRYAIFKVDVTDKKLKQTLVYADENYDIEGSLIYSKKTKDVIGVYHGEASNAKIYFDPNYERFQKSLNTAIPDAYNNIVSVSADENMYILFTSGSQTPGAYYLGNRKDKTLDFILEEYPLLYQKELSKKSKITFKARDGLDIEAYVTQPYKNVESKNVGLVIPHGGPMARSYGGFDWFSQFFASRGYTVIEPNFRGSSGYGFEFEMASIQKWGGAMQDDLADAAKWLAKSDSVDEDKICILGASYGGYAAMMAAVRQQDVFRCAASFAGVSDLEYIVRKARRFTNYKVVKKQIGDDSDILEQNSPVNFAKEVNIPLLLIHGDKDRVVDVYHSREMFDELEGFDKQVEYLELENGNHHLEIEQNRLDTLNAFDKFLSQHLK